MPNDDKNTLPQPLVEAHIGDPRFLSEQVLTDGIFGGSLTFPLIVDPEDSNNEANQTVTVPFILKGDFGFSLRNKWESIIPQDIGNILSKAVNYASMADITQDAQVQLVSKGMSVATWQGSETPNFKIDVAFVATRRSYNPVTIIKALAATCMPLKMVKSNQKGGVQNWKENSGTATENFGSSVNQQASQSSNSAIRTFGVYFEKLTRAVGGFIKNAGMYAPLNYRAVVDTENDTAIVSENCTVTLTIGKWFRARHLVVESIDGINFSRQTIAPKSDWSYQKDRKNHNKNIRLYGEPEIPPDNETDWGFPLVAECSLTLRPIMMLTYDEFLQYFLQPKYTKLNTTVVKTVTPGSINQNAISMEGGIG